VWGSFLKGKIAHSCKHLKKKKKKKIPFYLADTKWVSPKIIIIIIKKKFVLVLLYQVTR
jgi:hypothetical protein